MILIEIEGPDHGQPAVYYRTVVEAHEQRKAVERLLAVLPGDDWRIIARPLGTLDGIVEWLRSRVSPVKVGN